MSYSLRQNLANPRNYTVGRDGSPISEILIHHAATTSFDGIGRTFKNAATGVSAHYGVGQNGNVDQYVAEGNIAYHAGNWSHNKKSIGIENVNLTGAPHWKVADSTFDTLVDLVRDIAKRHGLLPLKVGVNLFGHNDVSDLGTACPAALKPRLAELAKRVNSGTSAKPKKPDQVLHVGEKFKFTKPYRVDDLRKIGGIWQVRTNKLCPKGFTWADNGIPTGPLTEVAPNKDQILAVGSTYTIPGTYTVLNLGSYQGIWMAQIDMQGWKLWVDVATVTEV